MSTIASLDVDLLLNTAHFVEGLHASRRETEGFAKQVGEIGETAERALDRFKGIGGNLVEAFSVGYAVERAAEAEQAMTKLTAVVRASGEAAGFSAQQLAGAARELSEITTYSSEAYESAETLLSTFDQIKGDNFKEALKVSADLASVFDVDLSSAAEHVGRALQNPIDGMKALSRMGVQFSAAQKEVIQSLVETGKQAEAQAQILKDIEGKVGGTAEAMASTTIGSFQTLKNQIDEVAASFGAVLLPAVHGAAEAMNAASAAGLEYRNISVAVEGLALAYEHVARSAKAAGTSMALQSPQFAVGHLASGMSGQELEFAGAAAKGLEQAAMAARSTASGFLALAAPLAETVTGVGLVVGSLGAFKEALDDAYRASKAPTEKDVRDSMNAGADRADAEYGNLGSSRDLAKSASEQITAARALADSLQAPTAQIAGERAAEARQLAEHLKAQREADEKEIARREQYVATLEEGTKQYRENVKILSELKDWAQGLAKQERDARFVAHDLEQAQREKIDRETAEHAAEQGRQLAAAAASIKESVKTPIERAHEQFSMLDLLHGKGLLNDSQYLKAEVKALTDYRQEMAGDARHDPAGALLKGSQSEYENEIRARSTFAGNNPQLDVARQSLEAQRQAVAALRDLLGKLLPNPPENVFELTN